MAHVIVIFNSLEGPLTPRDCTWLVEPTKEVAWDQPFSETDWCWTAMAEDPKVPERPQKKTFPSTNNLIQSVQRGLHWWYDQITKKISSGYTMLHICFTSHKTHAVKNQTCSIVFSKFGTPQFPLYIMLNHLVPLEYQINWRCLPQCSDKTMCPNDWWQLNWLVKDHMSGWSNSS